MTAPPVITKFRRLLDPAGEEWYPETWGDVFSFLSSPTRFLGKNDHPGWSAVRYDPCSRSLETVRSVFALTLDYDHGESIETIVGRLGSFYGLLHTSRRHTPAAHRFRVVLPLSRPVSRFEYSALWDRFAPFAGTVDPAPKDPSRFWFAPCDPAEGEFRVEGLDGKPLDVDDWLSKPDPAVRVERVPDPYRSRDQAAVEENARAYIARMPEAISGSHGHDATFDVAVALARGFGLGEDATFRILWNDYNPRCSPPWNERAIRRKAQQAQVANRVPLGYLLREDRPEWTPRRPRPEMPPPDYWDDGRDEDDPYGITTEPEQPDRQPDDDLPAPPRKTAVERWGAVGLKTMFTEVFIDASAPEKARGLTSGIEVLDTQLGGYRRGNMTIIGAQTSWGKSSMGVMALQENHKHGERVLIISCEDKRLLYGRRLACRMGGISALRIRDGKLRSDELASIAKMANDANDEPVFLDATGWSIEKTTRAVREVCSEIPFALVIADYLQRWRTERKNMDRRNEVGLVMGLLSDEVKRINAAGLFMCQLKRIDNEPTLGDLKEAGELENMAEHVVLGWRIIRGNQRKLGVRKNKDGPVDDDWHELEFDERTANFTGRVLDRFTGEPPPDYGTHYDSMGDSRYP